MANDAWGLESLTYSPFVLLGAGTDYKLKFQVYGGSTYINVMKEKAKDSEIFKTMNAIVKEIVIDHIDKIETAGPETRYPIVIGRYDKNERKFVTDYIVELYKDSKLVYHICIIVKNGKYDFVLNGPNGISIGSEPLSEADRSMYCLRSLKTWLKYRSELQGTLSNKRRDPSTFRGGSRSTSGNRVDNENAGQMSSEDSGSQYF